MDYISTKEAALKWGISQRRVRILCEEGAVKGVLRVGKSYNIPKDAKKPFDKRFKQLTLEIIYNLIEEKKLILNSKRPLTKGELERLNEDFLISYTYNSNAIEGSTLTLNETAIALKGVTISQKPLRDYLDAIQHRDAFEYVKKLVSTKEVLSELTIKEIHSIVLNDRPMDRGVYRQIGVRILGASIIPPNPLKIPELMRNLIKEYPINPTIKDITRFHVMFERIHPFIDGNGRTGRLIMNFELIRLGYPPIDIKFSDRDEYYVSLNQYGLNNNSSAIERLIALNVLDSISNILSILE